MYTYDWITDRLAIGPGILAPEDLPFDAILSMSNHAPVGLAAWVRANHTIYEWCPLVDDFCINAHAEIVATFDRAAATIDRWLREGKRVLVHCEGGISRSATAIVWYLVRYGGYTWDDALALVRSRRAIVNPDISFELPIRMTYDATITAEWIEARIAAYVEDYRRLGRTDRGRGLDTAFVRDALVRQGTLR